MSRTKFAEIGLGWFGEKYCEALAANSGVQSMSDHFLM